jgi:hypothetical protein
MRHPPRIARRDQKFYVDASEGLGVGVVNNCGHDQYDWVRGRSTITPPTAAFIDSAFGDNFVHKNIVRVDNQIVEQLRFEASSRS